MKFRLGQRMPGHPATAEVGDSSEAAVAAHGAAPAAHGSSSRLRAGVAKHGALAAMLITFIAFSLLKPDSFLTWVTIKAILRDMAPLLILALAATVVLVTNQFDLSIGGMTGLLGTAAVVFLSSIKLGLPLVVALLLVLVAGAGLGFVNGLLVSYAGASSFMATIAMGSVFGGIDLILLQDGSIFEGIPESFSEIANATILGFSSQVFVALGAVIVVWVLLEHSQIGRSLYAIGGNSEAARLSGIPVRALRAFAFVCVGVLAAVAAILISSQASAANPNAGTGYLLPLYAAAFLGSVMWRSGSFTAFGTLLGALFLQIIGTGLSLFNLSGAIVLLVQGSILVFAILVSRLGKEE